ncbi:MAG: Holliday junction resolvase-like protein [Candidatus Caenarcaniphilales bacterium]|nr:Holliday junction resolvase-like protein [Candidatus Caenarcaniphilales bacterium]
MQIENIIILVLAVLALGLLIKYFFLKATLESKARELFDKWSDGELNKFKSEIKEQMLKEAAILSQQWMQEKEREIRKDAIDRSKDVIKGKVTEHLLPFFDDFPYNPMDARFLGAPVDLVVFDGLSKGDVKQVIFLEIKSGKWASLNEREKQVKKCIERGNVKYQILQLNKLTAIVD